MEDITKTKGGARPGSGRKPDGRKKVVAKLDLEYYEMLGRYVEQEGISKSDYIRHVVQKSLGRKVIL